MSLAEQSQKWFPTHVQATVLQAKDLLPKGKHGSNDAYTIIQLGKEKYSTSVAEKTLNPVWKEEASFELPGLLLEGNPEIYELYLIVMHRSLVGLDKFLGQKAINLNEIFDKKERRKTDWFSLESKPGKKRKERGQIQVSIQFMRNNMTASMFDLSMKDKPRSPFSKLKDKMKGRKHDGMLSDTSSAILPRSPHCDTDSQLSEQDRQLKSKPKRTLLLGPQKLSAAHSMSDLMGTHFRPKLDSMNSIEESGSGASPHRRSQSEVPHGLPSQNYGKSDSHGDPFADISDSLPQKYATLPRNRNPFESEQTMSWDKPDKKEKKEKVSLLERVTGKKDGKKISNGAKSGSSGDLRSPNPFSDDGPGDKDSNPFASSYKTATTGAKTSSNLKKPMSSEDISPNRHGSPHKKGNQGKKNDESKASVASYSSLSFEEVVQELIKQKEVVKKKDAHIRELEDYIDDLLVRVMEETPSILRKPYEPNKKAGKFSKK
ncbi:rab11 family-interacting protein 2 [Amia ocellicauda]|uniref:rab11 family-interacting protein 2 n=1 Tax=Amia ocellicauda TaxID=2972642 RepID=UPI00346417A4